MDKELVNLWNKAQGSVTGFRQFQNLLAGLRVVDEGGKLKLPYDKLLSLTMEDLKTVSRLTPLRERITLV